METHSRILIQNCVLDILFLTYVMFAQVLYILGDSGNSVYIFIGGILFEFMKNNFNKIIYLSFLYFGSFYYIINLYGLCAQFVYRYLVLNRNMKINYKRYLLYMFSTVLIVGLSHNLISISSVCNIQLMEVLNSLMKNI
uniref:Uncharacterized protein n=1 Tax=Meloidogyne enterolobii TaxID=390850 RepID=A0A6V7VHG4_MELEN|nr:unnamed protein product [Meloidogyne enterolobii]